jgi:hypothetical protein
MPRPRTGLSASLPAEHRVGAAVGRNRVAAPGAAPAVAPEVSQDGAGTRDAVSPVAVRPNLGGDDMAAALPVLNLDAVNVRFCHVRRPASAEPQTCQRTDCG